LASILVGLGLGGIAGATPADAEIDGPCSGSAEFNKGGFTVDANELAPGEVVEVPVADTVHWQGAIDGVSGERDIDGSVSVDLPWPLGEATIDSWDGSTTETGNQGVKTYDLPSLIPRGVEFEVKGQHSEDGTVVCTGTVTVKVEGSAFDSPLTPVALAGTAISGVGLVLAGRPVLSKLAARGAA
jgi:hypothetical protein